MSLVPGQPLSRPGSEHLPSAGKRQVPLLQGGYPRSRQAGRCVCGLASGNGIPSCGQFGYFAGKHRSGRSICRSTFQTTVEVLEAMQRHKVSRIFFANYVGGVWRHSKFLKEETGPLRPVSFYGASKLSAEAYLSVYAQSFGYRTWILRFPNVVGERSTHGMRSTDFHPAACRKIPIPPWTCSKAG